MGRGFRVNLKLDSSIVQIKSGSSLEIYKWLIAAWFFPGEGDIFPEVLLEAGSTQGCQMKNMFTNKIFLSQQKTKMQSFSRRFFAWKYSYSWTITRVSVTLLYKEHLEIFNDFFVFVKCSLVSFWLRDYKYPFLVSHTKGCFSLVSFSSSKYISRSFSRKHFSFKELSLEQIGVLKESFGVFHNLAFSHPKSQDQT